MKRNNNKESAVRSPYIRLALDVTSKVSANLVNVVSNLYKSGTNDLMVPIGDDINIIRDRLPSIGRYAGPETDHFLNAAIDNIVGILARRSWQQTMDADSAVIWYLFIIHDIAEKIKTKGGRINLNAITMMADYKADCWNKIYKNFLENKKDDSTRYA
jgi:hypothetical protein